jgi:uncharacterized cupin superfamily protein|tara:strand:+ start:81 stop:566 length:486 start_codon:yes stop_codon:yes gene_type:complete
MPKIYLNDTEYSEGRYPKELMQYYQGNTDTYKQIKVGDLGGLTQFGVNKTILPTNSATAMRHWHEEEDEFVFIISGSAILVDKDGEHEMNAGDCATFKAGDNNGHAIVNKSNEDVVLLEVGTRSQKEIVHYTDKDLINDVDRTQTKQYTFKDSSGKVIYSI